jgi:hypothetical protein
MTETTRQEIYSNVLSFIEGVLSSRLEVTDLARKNSLSLFGQEWLEFKYKGNTIDVSLSDNKSRNYTLDKVTATFKLDDWWDSEYQSDRQLKRFISIQDSKLDIKKLLKGLDEKIEAYDESCKEKARVEERKVMSTNRVEASVEALREVFPDLGKKFGNEVTCRGLNIEVSKYEDNTYKLSGQTKKYDLRGITQAVKVLNVIKEKDDE